MSKSFSGTLSGLGDCGLASCYWPPVSIDRPESFMYLASIAIQGKASEATRFSGQAHGGRRATLMIRVAIIAPARKKTHQLGPQPKLLWSEDLYMRGRPATVKQGCGVGAKSNWVREKGPPRWVSRHGIGGPFEGLKIRDYHHLAAKNPSVAFLRSICFTL